MPDDTGKYKAYTDLSDEASSGTPTTALTSSEWKVSSPPVPILATLLNQGFGNHLCKFYVWVSREQGLCVSQPSQFHITYLVWPQD